MDLVAIVATASVLFALIGLSEPVADRLRLPSTVILALIGILLGATSALVAWLPPSQALSEAAQLVQNLPIRSNLFLYVFLPTLIFQVSLSIDLRRMLDDWVPILSLAVVAVVVSTLVVGWALVPFSGLSLFACLMIGAIVSTTDPSAVVGIFRATPAPLRLARIVEGESLLNDGTAVVVFSLVLALVMGKPMSLSLAILDFARVVGMGVLIGAAVGYAVSMVIHKVDDPMIEITLTTIGAYGSFVAAEFFHYSGVIAVVTSGMLCGNYAARTGMSASTRVAVSSFWEYLAFALNSLVFLLIGFEVKVEKILEAWKPILIAYVSVLLVRAIVIHVVGFLLRGTRERFPLAWANVLTWGGLRGSLSMVLVLALPQEFPHRDLVVAMTFGVVILSILVQGLTMGPLLRRLKLVGISEGRAEYDRLKGALSAVNAALVEVEKMEIERGIPKVVTDEVRAHYARRADEYEEAVADLHLKAERLLEEDRLRAARRALIAEKDALVTAYKSGQIAEESYEHLVADVDARLFELEAGESDGH